MKSKRKRRKLNTKRIFFAFLILCAIIIGFISLINKNSNTTNSQNTTVSDNSSNNSSQNSNTTTEAKPSIVDTLTPEQIQISQDRGLPVLMYHFFYDETAGETGKDNNYMEIHDFEEQIKYLAENNYYVPTWEEVVSYVNGKKGLPEKSIIITVDDGDESFFRLAVPILEKYNFTATSFLITSWYGSATSKHASSVVDYQSHSDNMHRAGSDGKGAFLTLSYENACKDLEQSRAIIGDGCRVFCYPFGHFNDNVKNTLKDCNYILAFTTKNGRVFPGMDVYELPRVRMSKGVSLNAFINMVK